jgi:hypothetical protein
MHWFQVTYTSRFNIRHRLAGHLFGGRYKALPIGQENKDDPFFLRFFLFRETTTVE